MLLAFSTSISSGGTPVPFDRSGIAANRGPGIHPVAEGWIAGAGSVIGKCTHEL
jgi:hypothetical protein